ncbi:MAG: peptidase MA family metallohydrolase [Elusimicrobia bacterium]|nr:peptidase MA family metallohydrolase [Elusimicrobiota bacterium]
MKLFGFEIERSYWLLTIGVVVGIYLWFFLMTVSRFIDLKNAKIERKYEEEVESIKEQIIIVQRLKSDNAPYADVSLTIPDGLNQIYTTHFIIYSSNEPLLKELSQQVETIFSTIIADTNLYNFKPPERFPIYIYKDAQMYKEFTKRPEWSGGFVMDRKIYTFEGNHLKYILSHEIAHLIFNDFMDNKAVNISKWINEGVAMYEENKVSNIEKPQFDKSKRISMQEFLAFDILSAETSKVSLWYLQADSLVTFLLEKRAKLKFYNFLTKLKETENFDEALFWGYQSEFKNIADLESAWLDDK